MQIELQTGDMIKCKDKEDAGKVADALCDLGYKWDYKFEHKGSRGIWIEIQGRYFDGRKGVD